MVGAATSRSDGGGWRGFRTERHSQREAIAKIKERVIQLEATNGLEARFARLAAEANGGPEIQQSELLARIERLQRQLDELKRVAAQPGPQGPPGKLPLVREYVPEQVHYEGDVVTRAGALWQAQCDTVHAPPHEDWGAPCARWPRCGDADSLGAYDACGKYKKLDIVVSDGAAFIAKRDDPGICPGDGWQLMSSTGQARPQGRRWCARSAWRKGREGRAWHDCRCMAA